MSDDTYLVTLPNGKTRGPFSIEVLADLLQGGGLPGNATIFVEGSSRPLSDALPQLAAEKRKRTSAARRALLGGTQAATPKALSAAEAERKS